ncbi:MAG: hypothetical protein QG550_1786 [Pseudomonadota bacterium]|nr:hypothetical protein [Pseudomonadota bacterium]
MGRLPTPAGWGPGGTGDLGTWEAGDVRCTGVGGDVATGRLSAGVARGGAVESAAPSWSARRAVEFGSPGTDALGRAGVTGEVDTQFAARFGAAILISLIDAAAAAVGIGPVIRVAPGERLSVMVARDVSFEQVYALAHR